MQDTPCVLEIFFKWLQGQERDGVSRIDSPPMSRCM